MTFVRRPRPIVAVTTLPAPARTRRVDSEEDGMGVATERKRSRSASKNGVPRQRRVEHFTPAERAARGRAARAEVPRSSHADLPPGGRDPVALLDGDSPNRAPELVPIRYERMLVSPFTFYRGSAVLMAHDLSPTPRSGLQVQLCGDAHLANFGVFASPERELLFDINDFDETHPGPFEWDVKRLATSFEIAARHRGVADEGRKAIVLGVVRSYREAMQEFASMTNLAVWYSRLDIAQIEAQLRRQNDKKIAKSIARGAKKAQTKDSLKAFAKLTHDVDGEPRIISDPPLIVPIEELLPENEARDATEWMREMLRSYRGTLQDDRRTLLESFRYAHIARKVVGVGSVGTRCWIVLLLGRDTTDPLFLQAKEVGPSALEPYLGRSRFANNGQRVVDGQRLMQAASDIFLGWVHVKTGLDGQPRDFYVRQLWDWKGSADFDAITPSGLMFYAGVCGWTLARAHARSGDRIAIASYLGASDRFDRAVADFAAAYADRNDVDYEALAAAAREGRIATHAAA
jgi:uncharacterized protein (DUF2252 family)